MDKKRRAFLKSVGAITPFVLPPFNRLLAMKYFASGETGNHLNFRKQFSAITDRTWIGQDFWAVPMEDWEVRGGQLLFTGQEKKSRLHLLTYTLGKGEGDFAVTCNLGIDSNKVKGAAGVCLAITDGTDAGVRSACYYGYGISVGINTDRQLFLDGVKSALPANFNISNFTLLVTGSAKAGSTMLRLVATDESGVTATAQENIQKNINGLIAIETRVDNKSNQGNAFYCSQLEATGAKLEHTPANSFGPILWTMYSLSRGKVKFAVQMPPLGLKDSQLVSLQLKKNGGWSKVADQSIDPVSFTCHFTLDNWQGNADMPFRVVYQNEGLTHLHDGVIRKEPASGQLKFGGLTCQQWGGYPYRPVMENLEKHNPDILFFSGDQIYEENGGYPIKRQPEDKAILSYLGKWYMFGWVFGNIMRDRPTICTPDDHDVFQGNLWGEGGQGIAFDEWEKVKDAHGGLVQTPAMVNLVNKTQCGHLPKPWLQQPLASGITNWFTHLVYGKVSFAIVSDRMFKSGPEMIRKGTGRIDHIKEPLSPGELEKEGLTFMGNPQMQFLNEWIEDWQGADMKVLLSQTLFSNVGTHHGPDKMFLYGDMDSGGWPKHQRDEVIRTIRKACAFHINGDQHVPFIVQYSVDGARDGGWTFCTPAISTGYPRWGQPDLEKIPFTMRPSHGLPNTGLYKDVFGNDNYVYAVGNPTDDFMKEPDRYLRAQQKSSGIGIVTFNSLNQTIKMEAFRFLADKNKPTSNDQFPGWPHTIAVSDNDGRKAMNYLPQLNINKPNQLVKIIDDDSGELVSILRIKDRKHTPKVFKKGKYTIVVGERDNAKTISGIMAGNAQTPIQVVV